MTGPARLVAVVGRLSRSPNMRYGRKGPFAIAGVVVPNGREPVLVEVVAYRDVAVPLSELRKGDRVVVAGRVEERKWTGGDGRERTDERLVVVAVGLDVSPDLRPQRSERKGRVT